MNLKVQDGFLSGYDLFIVVSGNQSQALIRFFLSQSRAGYKHKYKPEN